MDTIEGRPNTEIAEIEASESYLDSIENVRMELEQEIEVRLPRLRKTLTFQFNFVGFYFCFIGINCLVAQELWLPFFLFLAIGAIPLTIAQKIESGEKDEAVERLALRKFAISTGIMKDYSELNLSPEQLRLKLVESMQIRAGRQTQMKLSCPIFYQLPSGEYLEPTQTA